jgi:hypothetical protein
MCTIFFVQTLSAQVLNYDMIERNANTDVRLTLKDMKSSQPIPWASVYLIPAGDTTITHFALSDDNGDVLLKEVPVGKYELNAEIIGYTPHKKIYTIKAHWDAYDLGIIKMEENPEFLEASTVSAIGNPVTVKKDTIEFNASSFRVGENAMLEDLLKKMQRHISRKTSASLLLHSFQEYQHLQEKEWVMLELLSQVIQVQHKASRKL